jgi:hypothetical protein
MGLLALPLLLVLLGCVVPGLGLLGWSARSGGWRWWTLALGLGGALVAGGASHLVPYARHAGSEVNGFSFLFTEVAGGLALAGVAIVLAVPAIWKRRAGLGALSGALFLAASLQPVLWFSCNEWLSTAFGIAFTY